PTGSATPGRGPGSWRRAGRAWGTSGPSATSPGSWSSSARPWGGLSSRPTAADLPGRADVGGRVWQLVPVLDEGDAIGDHARRMASILGERHAGFVVERSAPALKRLTTHVSNIEARAVDPADI